MDVSVEESQNKSGEVWTRKTNETEPLLSHRKSFSNVKTMAICGDMGIVCKEPDYCADGVRCAGGVSLVWAIVGNCRKQSSG